MQVTHTTFREEDGSNTLTLMIDDLDRKIVARVKRYGTGEFLVQCPELEEASNGGDLGYNSDIRFWGEAFTYANPVTAGHLIHDVWANT